MLVRDYCEGLRDSLDLVPIGAWHGNGRKAGWMSPFLLAAYDPDSETYQSVCRCISGFSDAFYAEVRPRGPSQGIVSGKKCSQGFGRACVGLQRHHLHGGLSPGACARRSRGLAVGIGTCAQVVAERYHQSSIRTRLFAGCWAPSVDGQSGTEEADP